MNSPLNKIKRALTIEKIKAVKKIADEKKIEMPIMQTLFNILYNNFSIKEEIDVLLGRPLTNEFEKK